MTTPTGLDPRIVEDFEETQLLRLVDPDYADGVSAPRDGVNAADIAKTLFAQNGVDMPNAQQLSETWVTWGQFIDHDIDLTPEGNSEIIEVEGLIAPVARSVFDADTGTGPSDPREQTNRITPLMDASQVYGSDAAREAALRSFEGGRLRTSDGADGVDFLPFNTGRIPNGGDNDPADPLFVAGDVRANENVALTVMHTVFVNEHNYWADRFAAENPGCTDEEIFQSARAVVEAILQNITYNEYLPLLLGDDALGPLAESPDGIDPRVSNEFSTAAFRFGHSMVSPFQTRLEEDGTSSKLGDLAVENAFFNNEPILNGGIASMLRGTSATVAQALDAKVIDDLNFFLQSHTGEVGFSLPALNIVRGRDHGLPSYVEVRAELLGDIDPSALDPTDFSIVTSDASVQAELAEVYATVDQIDLWVGGLAEDAVDGAPVGALFHHILAEQFIRTRDADPLWFERRDWADENLLEEIRDTTLADVLMRSGGVDHIQRNVFIACDRIGGTDGRDVMYGDRDRALMIGFDGDDMIYGRRGWDDLFGDGGRDSLMGGRGADALYGGTGRDLLYGGAGADELRGGDGRDYLTGGAGRDVFVLHADDRREDVIRDFMRGNDKLAVKGFGAEFEDLEIVASHGDQLVYVHGELVAKLDDYSGTLDEDHFQFIG